MRRVVVIGDVATDVVARLSEPVTFGSDAAASVVLRGGGSGANVAAWVAAAGVDTTFVGCVGDDAAGITRGDELRATGVHCRLAVRAGTATGTVVVVVAPDGQRTMFPDRGANMALTPADVPSDVFSPGGHLHVSGYSLFATPARSAALEAISHARASGMTISIDPSSSAPLRSVGVEAFLSWTAGADVFLPNLDEAATLTGVNDPLQAARLLAASYREVVVTCGANGAVWSDGADVVAQPAPPVDGAETTGAGDAFSAGFLVSLLAGEPPPQRLRRGVALAAECVGHAGARPRIDHP